MSPSLVQLSRIATLRASALRILGLPSDSIPASVAKVQVGAVGTAPEVHPNKKIKLSSLVDITQDADLVPMSGTDLRGLFSDYKKSRGEFPHDDIEPTEDQISAVDQLIKADVPPYVDFAIFGPHGRRLLRKLTFISFQYQIQEGSWKRQELPGPPDVETWWKSWLVLKCTLLLLKVVLPERLEIYGEHIRKMAHQYGREVWFIIYQADVRMRSEEFERIRRRLHIEWEDSASDPASQRKVGYNPGLPWDSVFHVAVKDRDFWDSEVKDKVFFYLAKVQKRDQVCDDGTVQPDQAHQQGGYGSRIQIQRRGSRANFAPTPPWQQQPQWQPQGHQKGKGKQWSPRPPPPPQHKGGKGKGGKGKPGGKRPPGASGQNAQEVCIRYNRDLCSEPCPAGRRHVCSNCGGGHPSTRCNTQGANNFQ